MRRADPASEKDHTVRDGREEQSSRGSQRVISIAYRVRDKAYDSPSPDCYRLGECRFDSGAECLCTKVIKQSKNRRSSCYTEGGSFYVNRASHLRAGSAGKAILDTPILRQLPRESVGAVPVRSVVIRRQLENISFIVTDDGKGFEVGETTLGQPAGLGLVAITERVRMLDGQIDICSQKGKDTEICFSIPAKNQGAL